MFIVIITLSLILFLFENENFFYDDDYLTLKEKLNKSNNETIVICNNEYVIISPYDFYICGSINKNITLKTKTI
jgi:hypothetical protein